MAKSITAVFAQNNHTPDSVLLPCIISPKKLYNESAESWVFSFKTKWVQGTRLWNSFIQNPILPQVLETQGKLLFIRYSWYCSLYIERIQKSKHHSTVSSQPGFPGSYTDHDDKRNRIAPWLDQSSWTLGGLPQSEMYSSVKVHCCHIFFFLKFHVLIYRKELRKKTTFKSEF